LKHADVVNGREKTKNAKTRFYVKKTKLAEHIWGGLNAWRSQQSGAPHTAAGHVGRGGRGRPSW